MPATNPKEAATNWEQKTQMGVAKYLAKIPQMRQNYALGLERFWGVSSSSPCCTCGGRCWLLSRSICWPRLPRSLQPRFGQGDVRTCGSPPAHASERVPSPWCTGVRLPGTRS